MEQEEEEKKGQLWGKSVWVVGTFKLTQEIIYSTGRVLVFLGGWLRRRCCLSSPPGLAKRFTLVVVANSSSSSSVLVLVLVLLSLCIVVITIIIIIILNSLWLPICN